MNKKINLCNTYIWLWLLGFVQKLFITNSFVSLIFSVPLLLITLYCFVKMFELHRPKGAILALAVLFVVLVGYGVGLVLLDNAVRGMTKIKNNSFLLMALNSLGPVFSFYYFSKQGLLDKRKLTSWFFVFLVVSIVHYYDYRQRAFASLLEQGINYNYDDITNNASYFILGLFPFLFLLQKRPGIQYVSLGIIVFFLVSGLKRGAMVVCAFMLVWFLYVSIQFTSKSRKFLVLLLSIILIFFGWLFIMRFYENSDFFQIRLERTLEGSSSNRDLIYSTLWQHYLNNDNIIQLAFGEGGYHTFNVAGNDAHNDWLELLIDCGLFSVLIYFIYWICFLHDWWQSKPNHLLYSILGACLIYSFLRTVFSMSFSDMPFFTSMILGYCFAQVEQPVTQHDELFT